MSGQGGFTKLFSSITESTIWVEPYPTRIVWISMLAMADRKGRIFASVPGLARRAAVTLEECEIALRRFQEPDKYSRTPDHEGRRIAVIDGGWQLINHEKYRDARDEDARREYQRNWDREHRPTRSDKSDTNPTQPDKSGRKCSDSSESDKTGPFPTQAEADSEAEADKPLKAHFPEVTTSEAPNPPPRAAPSIKVPDEDQVRAFAALCTANRIRGATVHDPRIRQLVAEGVTEAQLRDALFFAGESKPPPDKIPFAYVLPILADVRSGKRAGRESYDPDATIKRALARIEAKEAANGPH